MLNIVHEHNTICLLLQGVNPWIEVDGGVGPKNAYKVRGTSFVTPLKDTKSV